MTDVILWTAETWYQLKCVLSSLNHRLKLLLAEIHTDPWALPLSFTKSLLCLLYRRPGEVKAIYQKPLNNSTVLSVSVKADTQSGDCLDILDAMHLRKLRNDQRRSFWVLRRPRNQYLTPFLLYTSVWSPDIVWMTGQTTVSAKTWRYLGTKVVKWQRNLRLYAPARLRSHFAVILNMGPDISATHIRGWKETNEQRTIRLVIPLED